VLAASPRTRRSAVTRFAASWPFTAGIEASSCSWRVTRPHSSRAILPTEARTERGGQRRAAQLEPGRRHYEPRCRRGRGWYRAARSPKPLTGRRRPSYRRSRRRFRRRPWSPRVIRSSAADSAHSRERIAHPRRDAGR
jgi:hypothetical protein